MASTATVTGVTSRELTSAGAPHPPATTALLAPLRAILAYPFLPGMAATLADYLGMALLTPALPYFLSERLDMDASATATWTGAVTTAQYAGGALGNMVVGTMGDVLGSRATLGVTLGGDVAFFAVTAFVADERVLVAVRFLAGLSSPLVAALHHILLVSRDKMHAMEGVNAYSASVNLGYCLGGVVVGVGYDEMGWVGLNLLSAAVALLAVGLVLGLVAPRAAKGPSLVATDAAKGERSTTSASGRTDAGMDAPDASEEKSASSRASSSVYFSGAMVSHMYTAFNTGYQFMGFIVLFTLLAKQILGWSPVAIGWSFMAIPVANTIAMYALIPPFVKRFGVHASVTCGAAVTALTLALFALPAVHTTAGGIIAVTFLLIVGVVILQVPNQMRIKTIADALAPDATGRVTGASRVCFAAGQTVAPVTCAVLYVRSPVYAIVSMLVVVLGVPLSFWLTGTRFFEDPREKEGDAEKDRMGGKSDFFEGETATGGGDERDGGDERTAGTRGTAGTKGRRRRRVDRDRGRRGGRFGGTRGGRRANERGGGDGGDEETGMMGGTRQR